MIRIFGYLSCITIGISVYGLFAIKDKVNTLNLSLREITKQIEQERDQIHILKAEFAYLTAPDRLRRLSSAYLNLESIKTTQMIKNLAWEANGEKKNRENEEKVSEDINENKGNFIKRNVRWRYKKGAVKYVHTVGN